MFASVAVAALLAAAAQAAPDAAPAEKPAAEAPAPKAKPKMRRVCYENKGTGSRLERKTCVMEKVNDEDADASKPAKPAA